MKKKKILKIIISILIVITLFMFVEQKAFAIHIDVNRIISSKDKGNATNTAAGIVAKTLNVFQVFGAGFAIIMLIVLGIHWIGAAPSGKAEMKKSVTAYVLGVIFIFAAIGLLQIIKTFVVNAEKEIGV